MANKNYNHFKFDRLYLAGVLALVGLGIVIIYSSSGAFAESKNLPNTFYLVSHLKKVVIALAAMALGMMVNFRVWQKLARPALFLVIGLLIFLITFSGISGVHGAKRWISIASFGLQPSEIAKVAVIFFLARLLAEKEEVMDQFKKGLLASLIMVGIVVSLVLAQPDYSTAALIVCIAVVMVFAAGARLSHMLIIGAAGLPLMIWLVLSSSYRLKRLTAFFHPEEYTASSYQSLQAIISLGNGGITGTGLGTGTQKLGYLPMPFTDTIFSILGEELGLLGTAGCLLLFSLVVWRGLRIAFRCGNRFGSLVAVGIVISISISVLMHVGVCTGIFPTTGQPLPFVSYGGTALVTMMFFTGVMLNISGNREDDPKLARQRTRKMVQSAWAKQRMRTA
jgi:cell division protein FtsW